VKGRAEHTLRFERRLNAPRKRIFELWTQPEAVRRWFGGLDVAVHSVEIDLTVGGKYRIAAQIESGELIVRGEFRRILPPEELVYSWIMESPQFRSPETLVRVEFHARGRQTDLVLTHGPFELPDLREIHAQGWQACFDALDTLL
jgi:uncharacterized protein YndB with AHSA1/START domain